MTPPPGDRANRLRVWSAVVRARRRAGPPSGAPSVSGRRLRPRMPSPLAFTDEQIAAIMNAAQPLARADRAAFLEAVVAALDGGAVGDGAVYR
jgi:predicted DNA-binding transcriptional regulator YafY